MEDGNVIGVDRGDAICAVKGDVRGDVSRGELSEQSLYGLVRMFEDWLLSRPRNEQLFDLDWLFGGQPMPMFVDRVAFTPGTRSVSFSLLKNGFSFIVRFQQQPGTITTRMHRYQPEARESFRQEQEQIVRSCNLRQRLESAQDRLRQLCLNESTGDKTPPCKEFRQFLQQKSGSTSVAQSIFQSAAQSMAQVARSPIAHLKKQSFRQHIEEIHRRLQEMETCWESNQTHVSCCPNERIFQRKYLESIQKIKQLEVNHSKQLFRLEATIKEMQYQYQSDIRRQEKKYKQQTEKLRRDLEEQLAISFREELRSEQLSMENSYLTKEAMFLNQIEALQGELRQQIVNNNVEREKVNKLEQSRVKQICQMQEKIDRMEGELKILKQQLTIERNLKVECLNRLRQFESVTKFTKQNGERMTKDTIQMKMTLQKAVEQLAECRWLMEKIRNDERSFEFVEQRIESLNKFSKLLKEEHIELFQMTFNRDRLKQLISAGDEDKENRSRMHNLSASTDCSLLKPSRRSRSTFHFDNRASFRGKEYELMQILLVQAQQLQNLL